MADEHRAWPRQGADFWRAHHVREDAPWVGDLVAELLRFPGMRHDD
jgi:phage terminase large subunit-like protein